MWRVGNVHHGDLAKPGAVYVGREGKGLAGSPLANPFRLDPTLPRGEQASVLDDYRRWLWHQLGADSPARRELERLAALPEGVLVCFCKPHPCHADVIVRAIEWIRDAGGPNDAK